MIENWFDCGILKLIHNLVVFRCGCQMTYPAGALSLLSRCFLNHDDVAELRALDPLPPPVPYAYDDERLSRR